MIRIGLTSLSAVVLMGVSIASAVASTVLHYDHLTDGNYRVAVTVAPTTQPAEVTVKAESRRLMLERVKVDAGQSKTFTFTVNIRNDVISGDHKVKLKDREHDPAVLHWDDRLSLEIFAFPGAVQSVDVKPAPDAITLFIAGDSTVTDQPKAPWNSWGQMLPRWFDDGVAVANYAESGESLRSFIGALRWEKMLTQMKPGDYLLVQFGHNDMKQGNAKDIGYGDNLKKFIHEAKAKGVTTILVTPMHRRNFDKDGKVVNTLKEFPQVVRDTAKEEGAGLIDLNNMSAAFYESMGKDGSKVAFQDGTHHNNYGSYELSKCIVMGIRADAPDLAKHLREDGPKDFDPGKPDDAKAFSIPDTDAGPTTKPEGN